MLHACKTLKKSSSLTVNLRLVYTSVQVAVNQSLRKSPTTSNLHLPVQLGNREIHS